MAENGEKNRTEGWLQMHELPVLLGEKDRTRAERIARDAESPGKKGIRTSERFFLDGTKVHDVSILRE